MQRKHSDQYENSNCNTLLQQRPRHNPPQHASLEKLELYSKAHFPCSPGGCDWCQVFPHGLDNSSSPDPQPYADTNTTIQQKPDRCCHFCRYIFRFINKIQSNQRTNGIAGRQESSGDFVGRPYLLTDGLNCLGPAFQLT